jgi:hypothetical protein
MSLPTVFPASTRRGVRLFEQRDVFWLRRALLRAPSMRAGPRFSPLLRRVHVGARR